MLKVSAFTFARDFSLRAIVKKSSILSTDCAQVGSCFRMKSHRHVTDDIPSAKQIFS